MKEYARKHARIKVFKNEEKHGVNGNVLSAMKRSEGDFIATADQDDIWEMNKIDLQMRAIEGKLLCSGLSRPI
ncbi:UNVERIFIED_CONTAM: glycosyltransferase, partial [Prevotella sp. 15_C9]